MKKFRSYSILAILLLLAIIFSFILISATWTVIPSHPCGNGKIDPGESCDPGGIALDSSVSVSWPDFGRYSCNKPYTQNECQCPTGCYSPADYTDYYSSVYDPLTGQYTPEIKKGCKFDSSYANKGCRVVGIVIDESGATSSSAKVTCNLEVYLSNACPDENAGAVNFSYSGEFKMEGLASSTSANPLGISGTIENSGEAEYEISGTINPNTGQISCSAYVNTTQEDWLGIEQTITLDCGSSTISDFDGDGFSGSSGDCDDWPYDDPVSLIGCTGERYDGSSGPMFSGSDYCFNDTNNDGMGDRANCSWCKFPGQKEDVDDVDNNCVGVCQGNVSRSCSINSSYPGDGADGGANSEHIGCYGVKNHYNKKDEFCQMVDENVAYGGGKVCSGYNRAVKWIEIIKDVELHGSTTYGDNLIAQKAETYTYYSYKPGGFEIEKNAPVEFNLEDNSNPSARPLKNDAGCYKKDVTVGQHVKQGSNPLAGWSLASYFGAGSIWPDPILPVSLIDYSCLAEEEDNAKSRGTISSTGIFPEQFIDSFRGELDFEDFWTNYESIVQEKEDGEFVWKWQTACVPKDKCADRGDNDGLENLYTTQPYKFYLPDVTLNSLTNSKIFKIGLIDVDDPNCKWETAPNDNSFIGYSNAGTPKKNPLVSDYPSSSYSFLADYCMDIDRDGFCYYSGLSSPIWEPYTGTLESAQFPDCDDGADSYSPLASSSLGWYGTASSDPHMNSWNIHPLAPVTPYSCFWDIDTNCNIDYYGGARITSLTQGTTIYDDDIHSGMERYVPMGSTGTSNIDYKCFSVGYKKEWAKFFGKNTAISLGYVLAVAALPYIPLAGIPLALTLSTYSSFKAGWDIGTAFMYPTDQNKLKAVSAVIKLTIMSVYPAPTQTKHLTTTTADHAGSLVLVSTLTNEDFKKVVLKSLFETAKGRQNFIP